VRPLERGGDFGFTGEAASVIIDDEYRLAAIREAETPRERFHAACGWLLKLARNGERAFEDLNEPAIRLAIDQAFNDLAPAVLLSAGRLRDALRDSVDPDHDPSGDDGWDQEVGSFEIGSFEIGSLVDWPNDEPTGGSAAA
jgi:hypothetical protein